MQYKVILSLARMLRI